MRCVSRISGFVRIVGTGPFAVSSAQPASQSGAAPAVGPPECECQEVLCGGTPLENGQSCCNGTPFTVGVQGCCRGIVVAAGATCDCPEPIDLATQSCCGNGTLELPPVLAAQFACCNRPGLAAAYSLNTHYDCCPESGPDFCFARCESGACVTDDCCECDCGPQGSRCVPPGSTLGFCGEDGNCISQFTDPDPTTPCRINCFQFFTPPCDFSALVEDTPCPTSTPTSTPTGTPTQTPTPIPQGGSCVADPTNCAAGLFCADGVCCDTPCDQPLQSCNLPGEVGTCSPVRASVPAASHTGLLLIVAVLGGVGAVALLRRRSIARYLGLI
jgi:hypothetical protein